jgi:hypothetical protein
MHDSSFHDVAVARSGHSPHSSVTSTGPFPVHGCDRFMLLRGLAPQKVRLDHNALTLQHLALGLLRPVGCPVVDMVVPCPR